jgi:hypothetical protein
MYSGTPCDLCGGPTLTLSRGSIWCGNEDAHFGGHFVTQVAFERSPLKGGTPTLGDVRATTRRAIKAPVDDLSRLGSLVKDEPKKAKPVDPFAVGMDAFIGEDAK